jgi:hypothetical protein
MWSVILGIFTATVFVVIFNEVFKNGREEIEFLMEDFLETEIHQLVDDGFAEIISLAAVSNVIAQFIKQWIFAPCLFLPKKYRC